MTWLLLLIVLVVLAGGWWGWPLAAALFGSRAIHDKTSALWLRGQVFHLLVCHGPVATHKRRPAPQWPEDSFPSEAVTPKGSVAEL